MTNWTNNSGIYTVPLPAKTDRRKIQLEMEMLEIKLQQAEAAMAMRKGMTA